MDRISQQTYVHSVLLSVCVRVCRTCFSAIPGLILFKLCTHLIPYLGHMHMQWFHDWIKDGWLVAILIVTMHAWSCILDMPGAIHFKLQKWIEHHSIHMYMQFFCFLSVHPSVRLCMNLAEPVSWTSLDWFSSNSVHA